jgi:hypothetical protein
MPASLSHYGDDKGTAMPLSMYQASVPCFIQLLTSLSGILERAAAYADRRKIDPAVLLNTRLYPDMFPLIYQVQLATDFAKGPAARLAGIEVPMFADTERSFEELAQRLKKTIDFLKKLKPEQIDGSEAREITIQVAGQKMTFEGQPYLLHFALPNFYFHVTIAYAILRHCGLEIGKRDLIGSF